MKETSVGVTPDTMPIRRTFPGQREPLVGWLACFHFGTEQEGAKKKPAQNHMIKVHPAWSGARGDLQWQLYLRLLAGKQPGSQLSLQTTMKRFCQPGELVSNYPTISIFALSLYLSSTRPVFVFANNQNHTILVSCSNAWVLLPRLHNVQHVYNITRAVVGIQSARSNIRYAQKTWKDPQNV